MDDYAFAYTDIVIFIIIKTINTTLIVSMILKKFLAHVRTECGPAPSSSSLIENLPWEANLHNIFGVHLPLPVFPLLAHFQEMVEDYHICIARRPAPCQGLHPQVHKTLQVSPEGYTISGRHSAHVANSAPSILKLYCNGRIHFAQNFKTWSTISCAIFGKHTNTDIFFDCYFFKITIIFSSCKAINPASNPQP